MITEQDITGTWLLVARGNDDPADEKVSLERYGDDPQGMVIISPDGWMNASLCHGSRPPLTGNPAWHTDAPDADRLAAYDTYIPMAVSGGWRTTRSSQMSHSPSIPAGSAASKSAASNCCPMAECGCCCPASGRTARWSMPGCSGAAPDNATK